jgi:hypothetical protein
MLSLRLPVTSFAWLLLATASYAKDPDCAGTNRWPTAMAFGHLKNAGLTTNDKLDFTKTKTTLLATQRLGKDLYRQLHHVVFTEHSGTTIEVITSNNVSSVECSESGVVVYVISKRLGGP